MQKLQFRSVQKYASLQTKYILNKATCKIGRPKFFAYAPTPLSRARQNMVVSQNRGPQYKPQNTIVHIMGTPNRYPLILGNLKIHYGSRSDVEKHILLLAQVISDALDLVQVQNLGVVVQDFGLIEVDNSACKGFRV